MLRVSISLKQHWVKGFINQGYTKLTAGLTIWHRLIYYKWDSAI